MNEIKIGLLGYGTVGTGVARMLLENRELLSSRVGAHLLLKYIADIDTSTDRGIKLDEGILTKDATKVLEDPEIDIIVEMIGGEGVAKDFMLKAINSGKHVVTANKALLAKHGHSIFRAAAEKKVDLAFEASVGGCMPVIKTLRESLVGNRIQTMTGILNGTCNYILSKITDDGSPFDIALAGAQEKGFAEADPTLDIEGIDTAHKLAILSAIAYGTRVNFDDIFVEGISKITPLDIDFARAFGYRIKLLAISKNRGDAIEARVHPTMIPAGNLLSDINGSLNALAISGDAVDRIMLIGHGAGEMPTASAVISDIVDISRNMMCGSSGRVPLLSFQEENIKDVPILPVEEIETHYYFRFAAFDSPGVLSRISGVLGDHGISIKSVHQKGRKTNGDVPVVMLTHHSKESNVKKALNEIASLDVVSDTPVKIRIEDENGQE